MDKKTKAFLSNVVIDSEGNLYQETISDSYPLNDVIIQQFTGLKDKNGKEIYEGDILYYNNPVHNLHGLKLSVDISPMHGVKIIHNGENFQYLRERIDTHMEVIGNIFETPEFLKN